MQHELFTAAPIWQPAPVLRAPDGRLLLPPRVRLLSLWQPYAGLVLAGVKTLETRTWPWPYPPGWLLIFATQALAEKAVRRIGPRAELHRKPRGVVIGLVWIQGSRKMRPKDEAAACIGFDPKLHVWGCDAPHLLPHPIPLKRGPQKFSSLPREQVEAALAA